MFHLLAYASSALDATAGDVQVAAVAEQIFRVNSNNFVMPSNVQMQFAYAGGLTLTRARIVTPKFRIPALPQIVNVNAALVIPSNPGLMDFRSHPLEFQANEEVRIDGTNGAANTIIAFLGISNGNLNPTIPDLDLRWARFTASPTGVALGWSARAEITFQDTLQSGIYGVYGLLATGTTQLATRLIFNNQAWRPGIIGAAASDIVQHYIFDKKLGEWGEFENSTPPGIEVFNSAAGAVTISGAMLLGLKQAA